MYELALYISQKHIYHGKRSNCRYCPIALALEEYFPTQHIGLMQVDYSPTIQAMNGWVRAWACWPALGIHISESRYCLKFELADDARTFVQNFDSGYYVEPQVVHLMFKGEE